MVVAERFLKKIRLESQVDLEVPRPVVNQILVDLALL
jgi:hypothetical protein